MSSFFTNPWVIGVGGGILSGFIVTFASRYFFSKKDDREYYNKVNQANKEVIYAIRPTISESNLPSINIIKSLISSNANKFNLNSSDLYSVEEIINYLIKEVMDSSFISSETKLNYCDNLNELIIETDKEDKIEFETEKKTEQRIYESRQRLLNYTSILLGITAALMTLIFSIFNVDSSLNGFFFDLSDIIKISLPIMTIFFASLFTSILFKIFKTRIKNKENETENNNTENIDEISN